MEARSERLEQLSPFQLKDELIRYAKDQTRAKAATHKFLNAGRGNPNWIAATPRDAFFLLGQFALAEARRTRDEGSLAGMPPSDGIAGRLHAFLDGAGSSAGATLLRTWRRLRDLDAWLRRRCLRARARRRDHRRQLSGTGPHAGPRREDRPPLSRQDDVRRPPPGRDVRSLRRRRRHGGDVLRLQEPGREPPPAPRRHDRPRRADLHARTSSCRGSSDYAFKTVEINQSALAADGRHTWQYPDEEIAKLADPTIKAFFLVNPSNPASYAMHPRDAAAHRRSGARTSAPI